VSPALPPGDHTQASDERIAARNNIALKFIKSNGIAVDDLNALVRGHPEYHSDNVHFNEAGIRLEAAQVAAQVAAQIENLLGR
jgi:lysophospholipase L1-like esterase